MVSIQLPGQMPPTSGSSDWSNCDPYMVYITCMVGHRHPCLRWASDSYQGLIPYFEPTFRAPDP